MLLKGSNPLEFILLMNRTKYKCMKIWLVLVLSIFLMSIIMYGIYVRDIYLNANGKKRAVRLSKALIEYHKKEGRIPTSLLNEMRLIGLLSDERGVNFELSIKENGDFRIQYLPEFSSFVPNWRTNTQKLEINWENGLGNARIYSSISMP